MKSESRRRSLIGELSKRRYYDLPLFFFSLRNFRAFSRVTTGRHARFTVSLPRKYQGCTNRITRSELSRKQIFPRFEFKLAQKWNRGGSRCARHILREHAILLSFHACARPFVRKKRKKGKIKLERNTPESLSRRLAIISRNKSQRVQHDSRSARKKMLQKRSALLKL